MKKEPKCPKCGMNHIAIITSKFGTYNKIKIGLIRTASLARYICTDCGYMEQYISEEKILRELRANLT